MARIKERAHQKRNQMIFRNVGRGYPAANSFVQFKKVKHFFPPWNMLTEHNETTL